MTMTRAQAEAEGFTIDDHCQPPLAYKGPRFHATEAHTIEEGPIVSLVELARRFTAAQWRVAAHIAATHSTEAACLAMAELADR